MKRVALNRDKRGVSPVIATILLVAIVVVLSATVYIMTSQVNTQTRIQALGSLVISKFTEHNISFTINLERPRMPTIDQITIKVIDDNGTIVDASNYDWGIIHISSDPATNLVKTGDILYIQSDTIRFESGFEVIMIISGYEGVIKGAVP